MSELGRERKRGQGVRMAGVPAMAALGMMLAIAGCKSTTAVPDDNALAGAVQNQLTNDQSLSGQVIEASVQGGVATIRGTVQNDAQRTLAARDAAGVAGVTKVVNTVTISGAPSGAPPVSAVATTRPPAPIPVPSPPKVKELIKSDHDRDHDRDRDRNHQPAPIERPTQDAGYPHPGPVGQPGPGPAQLAPVAPPPPPQPTFRNVTVAAGNTIPVRITQTLDSATTIADTAFSGVVASDIVIDGVVAIPAGSAVTGHVDAVQEAAHFKGSSLLTVSLTSIARRGEKIAVTSDPYSVQGKGRGVNTAEKTGGGAAVGAVLGGIFGGGKGAAIGAAAGGGLGAGSQAVTRGQQVQIASESVVRFRLASAISVRVRTDGSGDGNGNGQGGLQPR